MNLQPASHLCIGCGVCAGICPTANMKMKWSNDGCLLVEKGDRQCGKGCNLCEKVCPFVQGNDNEDLIGRELYGSGAGAIWSEDIGYHLQCWAGHCADTDIRLNGASGGLATWFLKKLLADRIVDKVICVTSGSGKRNLFHYGICSDPESVAAAAKSAYYPVELSEALRQVLADNSNYAIVCLPCMAKAVRLAQKSIPALARRIVAVVGLVCGHSVSSCFAEYVAGLAGAPSDRIKQVVFRTKDESRTATEFGTKVIWDDANGGTSEHTIYWSEGLSEAWTGHWFTPRPCFFCDDVFAELADLSVMDAWYGDYPSDYRGNNMAIARSELAADLIGAGVSSGELAMQPISEEAIRESQALVVEFKRAALGYRLLRESRRGRTLEKRVKPSNGLNRHQELQWETQMKAATVSPGIWTNSHDISIFRDKMRLLTNWDKICKRERWIGMPARVAGKIKNRLQRR